MNFKKFLHKWSKFVNRMNDKGIPIPMMRDPRTLEGSVSLTLLFCASLWVQLGLLGKFADMFKGINLEQAMQFFYACSALYFGTTWTGKDGSKIEGITKEETKTEISVTSSKEQK